MRLFGGKDKKELEEENQRLSFFLENSHKAIKGLKKAIRKCREKSEEKLEDLKKRYEEALAYAIKRMKEYKKLAQYWNEKYDKLKAELKLPPSPYAVFWRMHPAGKPDEVDVIYGEQTFKMLFRVENIDPKTVKCGSQVLLGGMGLVVEVINDYWPWGSEVSFLEKLSEEMVLVTDQFGNNQQCYLNPELKNQEFKKGDPLLNCLGLVVKSLPKTEEKEHLLKDYEVPDLDFKDVGGLSRQIEEIKEALLPFVEREAYIEGFKGKDMPRGILLDGPPGCGKTLLAKVIASQLAKLKGSRGYFIGLTSTELISKFVGETERHLRELFSRAEELVSQGGLVVIFFDEIDALIRSRDNAMEHEPWKADTVAQFCGLLDGIKPLGNVVVVGATNHKGLIDVAILRPGRISVHITVPRPNRKAAEEILRIYLTPDLPFGDKYLVDEYQYVDYFGDKETHQVSFNKDRERIREHFIEMVIRRIYYAGPTIKIILNDEAGNEETLTIDNRIEEMNETHNETRYLKNYISGDMLRNIVEKAKRIGFSRWAKRKRQNPNVKPELVKKDFFLAVDAEYRRIVSSLKKPKDRNKTPLGFIMPEDKKEE